jgi:hypothetical protein
MVKGCFEVIVWNWKKAYIWTLTNWFMRIFSALLLLFLSTFSFGQLEPQYYGTYKNEEGSAAYTVYTMDEVVDDCFVVEYVEYEDGDVIFAATGFGHCEGDAGHLLVQMENADTTIQVGFEIDDEGLKVMKVFMNDGSVVPFFNYAGDDLGSGGTDSEIYYMREDGSELMIIPGSEDKTIDFSIFFNVDGASCEKNHIANYMSAVNEQRTIYQCNLDGTCKLTFYFSTDSIEIKEEGCKGYHGRGCGEWTGLYILNR